MGKQLLSHKKVEYIELVYDLIFVYLVKRCDNLLVMEPSGFFSWASFDVYLFSCLVIMQIWVYSTLFINRYGQNGWAEHLLLIVNMFLLCFLATDTRNDWWAIYGQYQTAWGLILINQLLHYLRQLRRTHNVREQHFLIRRTVIFAIQTLMVFLAVPIYEQTGFSLAWPALAVGFIAPLVLLSLDRDVPTNIEHLAERVMLFVVLSFGETIISAAEYFEGGLTFETVYFAACAFAIVIGMLLGYGFAYNKLLDKRRMGVGTRYMLVHVPLIVAINDVTVGLEYMHEGESNDFLTLLFLVVSFLIFYAALLWLAHRAGKYYLPARQTWLPFIIISAIFAATAFCFTSNRWINAAISVVYPYAMYAAILLRKRQERKEHPDISAEEL
ncbi:MAG: low temperature requirement protein A [Clostridia bacterium]|nr:low temperature requirement protein A [Clostridia bacterium]